MGFNRPQEIKELLESLIEVKGNFEVVIIEDGSDDTCEEIVKAFDQKLNISYFFKANTGPGNSRNYGMQRARGNYFIILDSDVIVPSNYIKDVHTGLKSTYLDVYGGPDQAHASFTDTQKAIDFVMTAFLTTGGLRAGEVSTDYEPRSFNMGISKAAFLASGGFGSMHPGEDPDLSIRLRAQKFKIGFIKKAFVYHKRRVDFSNFSSQMLKFGMVRSILIKHYPHTHKFTYWFPSFYTLGLILSLLFLMFKVNLVIYAYLFYSILIFLGSVITHKDLKIGILSVYAVQIQFLSYGYGFLESYLKIHILRKKPKETYPNLFFNQ